MSRYAKTLSTGRSGDEAQRIVNEYMQSEGLKYVDERGEMVWRKGVGALTTPQFIKADVSADGVVSIQAWMAGAALIPGVWGGEIDPFDGSPYGFAIKAALKKRINELENRLGGTPITPAGWYPDPTQRFEQRYWNGSQWTADVVRGGVQAIDPAGAA
jgi:hypothetical protein